MTLLAQQPNIVLQNMKEFEERNTKRIDEEITFYLHHQAPINHNKGSLPLVRSYSGETIPDYNPEESHSKRIMRKIIRRNSIPSQKTFEKVREHLGEESLFYQLLINTCAISDEPWAY